MTDALHTPVPAFPVHVLAAAIPDILAVKNTIPHHEAQRLAPILLAVALRAAGRCLSDAELRPFGLRRLPQP